MFLCDNHLSQLFKRFVGVDVAKNIALKGFTL